MDFQCFWAASKVALTDQATAVYDLDALQAAQVALHGGRADVPTDCMFIYPPASLLLFLPLALLPYTMSAMASAGVDRRRHMPSPSERCCRDGGRSCPFSPFPRPC